MIELEIAKKHLDTVVKLEERVIEFKKINHDLQTCLDSPEIEKIRKNLIKTSSDLESSHLNLCYIAGQIRSSIHAIEELKKDKK